MAEETHSATIVAKCLFGHFSTFLAENIATALNRFGTTSKHPKNPTLSRGPLSIGTFTVEKINAKPMQNRCKIAIKSPKNPLLNVSGFDFGCDFPQFFSTVKPPSGWSNRAQIVFKTIPVKTDP